MSLLQKIRQLSGLRFFIVESLDKVSTYVSSMTYQRENLNLTPHSKLLLNTAALALLGVVIGYGFLSLHLQEREYRKNFESYLVKGGYVSTTNDSGYYMTMAKSYQRSNALTPPQVFPESLGTDNRSNLDIQIVGRILPIMIAEVSNVLDVSLERAGVFITYGSVSVTAILLFVFFWISGQPFLGFVAAFSGVASFPISTRMSIGMLDTDLLNLPFLFGILILFYCSVKTERHPYALLFAFVAGCLNFVFYLWFGKAGFTPLLLVSLFFLCIAYRKSLSLSLLVGLLFLLGSGLEQVFRILDSLQGFFSAYLWRYQPAGSTHEISTNHATVIWETISEVTPATLGIIDIWFGSRYLYFIGLFGWLLWLLQDWRRLFLCFPFVVFATLFHTSGLRFSFYSAPFIWVGIAVAFIALGRLLYSKFNPATQSVFSKSVMSILFVGTLVFVGAGATPGGVKPKPIIHADEVSELQDLLKQRTNPNAVIVSWWDAGYSLSYYTGLPTAFNEGSQLGLKTLYVARALVSSDPIYAANEIRSTTYFSEANLVKYYPKRPPVELAQGTDHDIFVFLPTNLESKMEGIKKIAATGQSKDSQDPKQSAFFNLYHRLPERWGDFERIGVADSGAALYRLPAPVSSSRKH